MKTSACSAGRATWSKAGFVWIVVIGSILHFVFQWSGGLPVIGALAPVNESVWEHLKLGYTAVLMFMLMELPKVQIADRGRYFLAKSAGIVAMSAFILLFFYAYTALTGEPILAVDISSFVFGAAICQWLSYRLEENSPLNPSPALGAGLFIAIGLVFVVFTFAPPHLPVFKDPVSGGFGI